jgi:hypothetical protein
MELIYLFIGLLIGILLVWLLVRAKYGNVLSGKSRESERNN